MKIVATYDFNNGMNNVNSIHSPEFNEIVQVINGIHAASYKTKTSTESTMMGRMLYSPTALNSAFKVGFDQFGWHSHKVNCDYKFGNFLEGYTPPKTTRGAFREMDFVKPERKIGVEVQFGKYAFMVYNVCAKMTIFRNLGIIDTGIEIVPVKNFADEMSTGVSYFEQFAWDLTQRGISNIDIPVLILGIDA